MASILIRNIDERIKRRLRSRAARRGRSMEHEAREILRTALTRQDKPPRNLYEAIRKRIEPLGGVELPLLPREPMRDPPKLRK
jgi:plasmid stability protein